MQAERTLQREERMGGDASAWRGVFPAVTTQFREDFSVDYDATRRIVRTLVDEGVSGLIACGSVGENTVLSAGEKREVLAAIRDAAATRVEGLMVMPPMVYSARPHEIVAYFKGAARASALPIMLYNNPPAY